jgi:putative salt-induced outer membrane protein YdiY
MQSPAWKARLAAFWIVAALCASESRADVVATLDGANLVGKITKVTPTELELDTAYAGVIVVKMDQVKSLETTNPITTKLTDETTVTGTTVLGEDKVLRITAEGQSTTAGIDRLMASWAPDKTPPPESGYDPRHWIYSIGANIAGKNGNSDEFSSNVLLDFSLVTRLDELRLYGSYTNAEQESEETSDEAIVGASYTAFFNDPWGWYVRGEAERDEFEDIDMRTTLAAGLSWRPINNDVRMLKFFAGLGYRAEAFDDGTNENSPTFDAGLNHRWKVTPWFELKNDVTYTPAIDDFGDYLLVQDSALEMPIGTEASVTRSWILRVGVRNDYKSEPAPDRDELDTTYYTRLLMRFE